MAACGRPRCTTPAIPQPGTLRDARIGFVGFGHIGQCGPGICSAPSAAPACAVTGSGRVDAAAHGLDWAGDTTALDRLLRESDVVVVSAPLTEATTGMIGAEQLRALGPDGVLINVGRGPLVDERALYDALLGGAIRAAAIDVWYRYPGARRPRRAQRAAVRRAAERADDPALVGHHAGIRSWAASTTSPPTSAGCSAANRCATWSRHVRAP